MIETVKIHENGYLVNGTLSVPEAEGNRHYQAVQEWIADGNTPEPADTVPEPIISVSPWQIRKALNQQGLRQQVEDAVANSGDNDLIDGWKYATSFVQDDPLVQAMAQALSLADDELKSLFELAQSL